MRKLVLLGLVFTLASGCGRGWLPMFGGARCQQGICGSAPAQPASYGADCGADCGRSAGYNTGVISGGERYGGVTSGDTYYGGGVIDGGIVTDGIPMESYPSQGTITRPPMQSLPQPSSAN